VTDFGRRVTMGQLEHLAIQRVGFKYRARAHGLSGALQLQSFMSMNAERHGKAFFDQIVRVAKGEASDHDKHNRFYDEYLAVMDMTAEFYLSTVERIFKEREIARNLFTVAGQQVDFGKITDVAVKTVEGAKDDISAPGQCLAALDLLTGLPRQQEGWCSIWSPGAAITASSPARNELAQLNIRPLVLNFIDAKVREKREPRDPVGRLPDDLERDDPAHRMPGEREAGGRVSEDGARHRLDGAVLGHMAHMDGSAGRERDDLRHEYTRIGRQSRHEHDRLCTPFHASPAS
jgi:poly(3-hydroxybutyrate) depolymerase